MTRQSTKNNKEYLESLSTESKAINTSCLESNLTKSDSHNNNTKSKNDRNIVSNMTDTHNIGTRSTETLQNLESNTIYIADVFSFLESLPNSSIDLSIIDPPYNLKVASWDSFKSEKEFLDFSFAWIDSMLSKLKKSASFYIFNTPKNCAFFLNHLQNKAYLQNWITWYKKDGFSANKRRFNTAQEAILFYTMDSKKYYFDSEAVRVPYDSTQRIAHAAKKGILKNGKRWYPNAKGKLCPDVWEIASERHRHKINGKLVKLSHPTPKPRAMIDRMIQASSKEGDLVLDLFAGTGMTSLCARDLGRNFIGCERDKSYVDSSLDVDFVVGGLIK